MPKGVVLYEINGPLFFGAAQKAMRALGLQSKETFKVLIIHLGRVPVIDATGLVALENTISGVLKARRDVIVAGPLPRPREIFDKAKLEKKHAGLHIVERSRRRDRARRGAARRSQDAAGAADAARLR